MLLVMLGLFGAALLYGDGVITPAISVLSAVEGFEVATTAFSPFVVPITCLILVICSPCRSAARAASARCSARSRSSGSSPSPRPGCPGSSATRRSWGAVNPFYAGASSSSTAFTASWCWAPWSYLVTGGEALYADMGHFGTHAIRIAWYACVFPALLINYFGQGALLLELPRGGRQPVLRPGLRRLALPDGDHRDRGHGGRVAGADLGRLLADPPGRAARLPAARHDHPHLRQDRGADLRPRGELDADGGLRGAGAGLSRARAPGRRLRHRGDRHHGHHLGPVLFRGARSVALEPSARRRPADPVSLLRSVLLHLLLGKIAHGGWFPLWWPGPSSPSC